MSVHVKIAQEGGFDLIEGRKRVDKKNIVYAQRGIKDSRTNLRFEAE